MNKLDMNETHVERQLREITSNFIHQRMIEIFVFKMNVTGLLAAVDL